jgi:hypothetical protein
VADGDRHIHATIHAGSEEPSITGSTIFRKEYKMMTLNPLRSSPGTDLSPIKNTMNQNISGLKDQVDLQKQFDKQMEQLQFESNLEASRHGFAKDLASKLGQA